MARCFFCFVAFSILMRPVAAQTRAGSRPEPLRVAGQPIELTITPVTSRTVRVTVSAFDGRGVAAAPCDEPFLVRRDWPAPLLRLRTLSGVKTAKTGDISVRASLNPLSIRIERPGLERGLTLDIDAAAGSLTLPLSGRPVFGLGQGGPQFDRTGISDPMINSASAYRLAVFGGRLPVPWLIDTSGWSAFVHQPQITVDLSGGRARFTPADPARTLPMDLFLSLSDSPGGLLEEYARLTGFPSLPPLWALGYQQSHRTIADREELVSIARTLREKKLPCDVLIYLGTGWCPSGWNTGHGSFTFHPKVFPNPEADIRALRELNFHVVLHAVFPPFRLYGRAADPADSVPDEMAAAHYWAKHVPVFRLGIDGWWPDASENLSPASRLARVRMYWEGPQLERPNRRPYALHRTGYAGMQRYGGWLWSGDVNSSWETLRTQVPVGINTGLSGIPFWGTDIGGFFPTRELTGELYVRWFQFGAFCPLFRAHGRPSHTRFPWGWNTGEIGPPEMESAPKGSALPDVAELRNPRVEPICRRYLELRYRLMPYLYSAAWEAHDTGMPIMRALWLHYPDDPRAAARGDEYLWGRDILVAPVTEKGAATRTVYLPPGDWYDFWTGKRVEGGRELSRDVDLETIPLYVRAGAILPMAPAKQYTSERPDSPLTIAIYPGADGRAAVYEDDGVSFDYEKGKFMRLRCEWNDRSRSLTLSLEAGSRLLPPAPRVVHVRLAPDDLEKRITFNGKAKRVRF